MIGCVSDGECWRYKMMKKLEEEENSCRRMDRGAWGNKKNEKNKKSRRKCEDEID